MACLGDCLDLGPPPDSILFMPPPPAPFLEETFSDVLLNTTPCSVIQFCESWSISNNLPNSVDYVEMPRKDIESWSVSSIDDTWLLVLVASSIGVLLLGALLAMFLLKCREIQMFGGNDCSMHSHDHRPMKSPDCTSLNNLNGTKLIHPADSVLYHGTSNMHDNRMVWAALTPRGTQHFISESYPTDLVDYRDTDDHYETIENLNVKPVFPPPHHPPPKYHHTYQKDYEYEDPTPLIESYQLNDMEHGDDHYSTPGENTDMRCASLGYTLRQGVFVRPQVSSPTRIEHPNLPPLNLYPHKSNTIQRKILSYRNVDTGTLPKYT